MVIASIVPATDKYILLTSCCSLFGFNTYSPSIYPTVTPATGPSNGISEIPSASDAPIVARFSGIFTPSYETVLITTWTAFKKLSGNSGLIGLSTNLEINISSVDGFDSLFTNPPGNLPDA